jgi:antitoxin (DNA-binding transcriptional repressor) of toxin-antitoxin stability system
MRHVSLRDANQGFAKLIAEVEAGEEVVLTRRGKPVARITREPEPQGKRRFTPEQQAAYDRLMARLREGLPLGGGTFRRDDLYDREA